MRQALLEGTVDDEPGLGPAKYEPVRAIEFHTRTTAKYYGDDYAVGSGELAE